MTLGASRIVFNTGEPAYAVDRNGRIVAWNDAASATFGIAEDKAVGSCCWDTLCGRDVFGNLYCGEHCPHREGIGGRHQREPCGDQPRRTGRKNR